MATLVPFILEHQGRYKQAVDIPPRASSTMWLLHRKFGRSRTGTVRKPVMAMLLASVLLGTLAGTARHGMVFASSVASEQRPVFGFGLRSGWPALTGLTHVQDNAATPAPPPSVRGKGTSATSRAASAASNAQEKQESLSSLQQSTVNIVKNIVGAGMLCMPSGVAAFSSSPGAVLPSLTFTLLFGLLSAYGFVLIADVCGRTGKKTYGEVWAKTVSPNTAWLPIVACLAKAGIGCMSYSMILGDCFSLVLEPLGLPSVLCSRSAVILLLTSLVLFPLCSMKSLAPMAKFSVLGVLGNTYVCLFVLGRFFDGSYRAGGAFYEHLQMKPQFAVASSHGAWSTMFNSGFLVLLSILSTAYLAHYNAPNYYEQLDPGPHGNRDRRFVVASVLGFAAAGLTMSLVMAGGFLTFGKSCSGLILNNYASSDCFAALARIAIGVSLLTAYPLVFFSFKKQIVDLVGQRAEKLATEKPGVLNCLVLGVVTILALYLHDLGKVAAFAGACFGSFLIYVAPSFMALRAQQLGLGPPSSGLGGKIGRVAQCVIIPFGLTLAAVGVFVTLRG